MAAKQRYYPGTEPAQVVWLGNFGLKLPTHGPTCGIAAGEITDTVADIDFLVWVLNVWNPAIQGDAQEATSYKGMIEDVTGPIVLVPAASTFASPPAVRPPGVLTRLFNLVARMKLATGYTEVIGTDLGVIGAADTTEHLVPTFKLKIIVIDTGSAVQIDFIKFGHDGVWIESRRGAGAWEPLGADMEKPYVDGRPLAVAAVPETRSYRLRFWDKGNPNGDWSPVQMITIGA